MGSLQCLLHRSLAKIFSSCLLSSSPRLSLRLLTSIPSGTWIWKKQPSSVTVNNDYPLCRYRCWGHCLIDTREFYSLVLLFIIILNQIPGGIVSLPIFATSKHLRICILITLFSLVKVGYNIFSIIYCLTPFSPSISDMIPETVISTSDNAMEATISLSILPLLSKENTLVWSSPLAIEPLWVVLLACLVTTKGSLGSSWRLFLLLPWNSSVSPWSYGQLGWGTLSLALKVLATRLDVSLYVHAESLRDSILNQ